MKKKSKSNPIWPYLGILGCLFLLSLAAPRAWERRAQRAVTPRPQELARTSPLALQAPEPDAVSVELESSDATELAPRAAELQFAEPFEASGRALVEPMVLVPPAPYFAEDFRLDDDSPLDAAPIDTTPLEIASLPSAPAPEAAEDVQEAAVAAGLNAPGANELRSDTDTLQPAFSQAADLATPGDSPVEETRAEESKAREIVEEQEPALQPSWPLPRKLLAQLSDLAYDDAQLVWVPRASQLINELCYAGDLATKRQTLAALRELVTRDAIQPGADSTLESHAIRARYGVTRWVDIWEAAADLEDRPAAIPPAEEVAARIRPALDSFTRLAAGSPAGQAWREYLELGQLESATSSGTSLSLRREIARQTIDRLNAPQLSRAQREFVSEGPLAILRTELQGWLANEFAIDSFLAHLEALEYSGLPSDGAAVAADYLNLLVMTDESAKTLAGHLDTHYRNANLRVALSSEFANRLVPQPGRIDTPVRDTVVNVPVRGNSSTFTKLSVLFVPDPQRIRIGLEAHGTVAANTVSDAGPARFQNRGQSTFLVRKLLVFGPQGLLVWPAVAEAENNYNYLVAMETDYDNVPIVGSIVRNIARTQHDEVSGQARRQTEAKVATRALQQLDGEVEARLADAERKMQRGQGATLRRLGLELVPISLATTEERVVGRMRLANGQQLGASTPRPRAPSDSWLSVQVHQSALNNLLGALDLEGRQFEVAELFTWVGAKLGRPELANQEDLPEDVRITFAANDAIRLQAVDGRVEVTFAIKELTHEGSRWKNFEVRTHYAPEIEGLAPRLTRVDTIRLDGESMRGKIEFKLRAIFSKVLSKNRDLRLMPESITGDERLRDMQVTQFTIEDGWIGLAYSPRRVSSRVATKPR